MLLPKAAVARRTTGVVGLGRDCIGSGVGMAQSAPDSRTRSQRVALSLSDPAPRKNSPSSRCYCAAVSRVSHFGRLLGRRTDLRSTREHSRALRRPFAVRWSRGRASRTGHSCTSTAPRSTPTQCSPARLSAVRSSSWTSCLRSRVMMPSKSSCARRARRSTSDAPRVCESWAIRPDSARSHTGYTFVAVGNTRMSFAGLGSSHQVQRLVETAADVGLDIAQTPKGYCAVNVRHR